MYSDDAWRAGHHAAALTAWIGFVAIAVAAIIGLVFVKSDSGSVIISTYEGVIFLATPILAVSVASLAARSSKAVDSLPPEQNQTEGLRDRLERGPNSLIERFKFAIDDHLPNLLLSGLSHRSAAVDYGITQKRIPRHASTRSFVMWILPACTNSGSVARFPVLVRVDIVSSPPVEFG